ncbi:glycosyltransferase [Gemmatimonas sp.]
MRVLVVVANPHWTMETRLMATLAAGLSERGEVVAVAVAHGSDTERQVERAWPRLSVRTVTGAGWMRQAMSLRATVAALRPDALLVGTVADAVLAATSGSKTNAIVRRVHGQMPDDQHAELPWRARFALTRARVTLWGADQLVVGWPEPALVTATDEQVRRLPVATSEVVLVPGPTLDEDTLTALRTIAQVRSRHPDLRLLLVGNAPSLQAIRLHAAALDLAAAIHLVGPEAMLGHQLSHARAAWITAAGDTGAVFALAAMQQGLPAIVPQRAHYRDLVLPGATGVLASPDALVPMAAELARLLADDVLQQHMSSAAAARATRTFGWQAFVDDAAEHLAQAAGQRSARVTRRPSLTPG